MHSDDVSVKKQPCDSDLGKLNLIVTVLRQCHRVLLQPVDETFLLDEICRILVTLAGYRLCWFGFSDDGNPAHSRIVARYGTGDREIFEPGDLPDPKTLYLPMKLDEEPQTTGIMAIYSAVPEGFTHDETLLLSLLAQDIAKNVSCFMTLTDRKKHPDFDAAPHSCSVDPDDLNGFQNAEFFFEG
jgi:hypothetical protein